MYTDIESIQITIALLKEYNIRHLVLSAGSRHTPFVRSVESDKFFTCYSVVDERSAGFFALGLIQELRCPVVIACTSGTSVANYASTTAEAFYNQLPLVVISVDRNPYYLNQQEEQMIPQREMLQSVCRKSVTLPMIKDSKDAWQCNRLVNEALLALDHHGKGPVHINIPVEQGLFSFNADKLPKVNKIDRVMPDAEDAWLRKAGELKNARILVSYGQNSPIDEEKIALLERFAQRYNAVFMVDHLSNLHCYGAVNVYNAARARYSTVVGEMVPDIVIAMNGNSVEIRGWLISRGGNYRFWNVLESGELSDPFRCLDTVFECDPFTFIEKMVSLAPEKDCTNKYYREWQELLAEVRQPEYDYSDIYAVEEMMKRLPKNSLLHLANSNSVRFPQHFDLDPSVSVYCNRGTNGIDGSMSTFIGQSCVHDGLCFLLIGDLSFFYDMNALWNKYVGKNVRILLNNNACGEIFYMNKQQDPKTVGRHIAADHETSARAWVTARGFRYLCATNKEELREAYEEFFREDAEGPIFLEVMTDKKKNVAEMDKFVAANTVKTLSSSVKGAIKHMIGR